MDEIKTKTGRVLSDEDLDALATEAERGYDVEKIQALNELVRRGERRAHLFFGALGALLGLALGFALFTHDHAAHPQMPCAADEVQVWVDHDAGTTRCVDSTDHGAHASG